jgi:hypothetical protein
VRIRVIRGPELLNRVAGLVSTNHTNFHESGQTEPSIQKPVPLRSFVRIRVIRGPELLNRVAGLVSTNHSNFHESGQANPLI